MLIPKITPTNFMLGCVLLLLHFHSAYGQNTVYSSAIISEEAVSLSSNAIDEDVLTKADISASSGTAFGIGAYDGHLEVQFPSLLNQNTTSFVKFDAEENILQPLVGGSLGNLLGNVLGAVLSGNQEFSVNAKNANTSVLLKNSGVPNDFGTDNLRVVINKDSDYFLAIAPDAPYNRVRISNSVGALLGLNTTRNLGVYEAFYPTGKTNGGSPTYTSYSGSGLTLDLLSVTGTGVLQPELAIDGDIDTFSELSLGILGVAANLEQTAYFDTPSGSDDVFYVTLAVDPSLLDLGIANNIQFTAQRASDAPVVDIPLSDLLDADLLGLLEDGEQATFSIKPPSAADRLTVRLSSLLNVALNQQMSIIEIYMAPDRPIIDPDSENVTICEGSSATLVARSQSSEPVELRWYDAEVNGTLLQTVASGEPFITPILNTSNTYYVASGYVGEAEESPRVAVEVNVVAIPTAADIEVFGNQNPTCSSNDVILVPSSEIEGDFTWFFDANGLDQITDGLVNAGVTYEVSDSGVLRISGLDETNSPYTFFVRLTDALAGCQNAPGDLKAVEVSVVDSGSTAVITLNESLSLDRLLTILGGTPDMDLNGSVSGNANPGDVINFALNGNSYTGTLDGNLDFSILIDGNDLVLDSDGILNGVVDGAICTLTQELPIELPDLILDNVFQVFCASSAPTIADLELNGSGLALFDSLEGSGLLALNTPLVDGGVYFAGFLNLPISLFSRVQINVTLIDIPAPTTSSSTQNFCTGTNPTLADIQINEMNVRFYDSAVDGSELNPSTALVDGNTYYAASVEGECESTNRLAISVRFVDNEPITLIGISEDACLNQSYTYTTETGKQNYVWTISGGTITDGGTISDDYVTVVWSNLQDTNISVSYFDRSSCITSKEFRQDVSVIECGEILGEEFCLFVFNEFTPNNDGFNDFFEVRCIEDYLSTLEVYSRNGNMVFKAMNYQNNWDGKANVSGTLNSGDHLPSGTYYYVIKIPELERDLVGWLQLARE
ncbi:MAG TPA: T9SS type B sorting domain-containing protein [Pricia antarctica]|uniref:T9SS type B sorting domain-containing protein n=4 Tax=root TaxID=1 RepID=A0A831QMW4_9FLAO|nr:T9SS type B sorting domain-containing protein [Pricia antarctica]